MFYLMSYKFTGAYSQVGYYQMGLVGIMMAVNLAFALSDISIRDICDYFSKFNEYKNNRQ